MSGAKYRDLSQLLAFIGAHSNGVTVKQVMHETERSRATVDRMIETLRSMQLVERAPPNGADHHRTVRWKACLKSNSRSDLPTDLSYSERSDLERLLPTLDDREGKSGLMKGRLQSLRPQDIHYAFGQQGCRRALACSPRRSFAYIHNTEIHRREL